MSRAINQSGPVNLTDHPSVAVVVLLRSYAPKFLEV